MDIAMGWPEWIMVVGVSLGVIVRMAKATGWRPKYDTSNGVYAVSIITYPVFTLGMLHWGGFFS